MKNDGDVVVSFSSNAEHSKHIFCGHLSGQMESLELSKYLESLNQKEYTILKFTFENQKNNPPYVVMIQKR